jgi:hypothetical protein
MASSWPGSESQGGDGNRFAHLKMDELREKQWATLIETQQWELGGLA